MPTSRAVVYSHFEIFPFTCASFHPARVGKQLPVLASRPRAAPTSASNFSLGLLGEDLTPRGESRLRRRSCRTAAMRCWLASDAIGGGELWKLAQKDMCLSSASTVLDRQISSFTASAHRPHIQRPP